MKDLLNDFLARTKSAVIDVALPINRLVDVVVVIPAKDEPNLLTTLEALLEAKLAESNVGVVVVFNGPISEGFEFRQRTFQQMVAFDRWKLQHPLLPVHKLEHFDADPKHIGVGDARKCGMDFALRWLHANDQPEGVIACLDADCVVSGNYLTYLERLKQDVTFRQGAMYFEHLPESGDELSESIVVYEAYLRYYKLAMQWAGHPQAMYTVGSTMVVRASAYLAAGGMNRRQAGEDFYFLQKLCKSGPVVDLTEATVYPSSRLSDRVPFGTGAAMNRWSQGDEEHRTAFSMKSFRAVKSWLESLPKLMDMDVKAWLSQTPEAIRTFVQDQKGEEALIDIKQYGTSFDTLNKRFFQWMNGLKMLQLLKHLRDEFENEAIEDMIEELGKELGQDWCGDIRKQLELMRLFEKNKA